MVFNGALCRIIRGQFADNYMFISIWWISMEPLPGYAKYSNDNKIPQ